MTLRGPIALFVSWTLHDVEEAVTFPAMFTALADETGVDALRLDRRQSWAAVGLMGAFVATACVAGARTGGRSGLYRAVVAGLEAHVATHIAASVVRRGYTAGVVTAVPIMLTGTVLARRELTRAGRPLRAKDSVIGAGILLPLALACQILARRIPRVSA